MIMSLHLTFKNIFVLNKRLLNKNVFDKGHLELSSQGLADIIIFCANINSTRLLGHCIPRKSKLELRTSL